MSMVDAAASETPDVVPGRRREVMVVLPGLLLAILLAMLDNMIVGTALPKIVGQLGGLDSISWVVTAYVLGTTVSTPLWGKIGDLYGRKNIFITSIVVFLIGSVLTGASQTMAQLIGFRALQGLGGALFAPAALSILMTTFAEGAERNRALGIWGAASGSGGAAGVLLGGVLTSYLSWPWVFFINVPVGLAVIAAAPAVLQESRGQHKHRHFDVAGATSVTAGVMLLVYAMTRATQEGWSSFGTLGLLAASAALLAAFVAIELRSPAPLLPMRIFRLRSLSAANAVATMVGAVAFSQFFLLTLYMQGVLGYSAVETGVGFAAVTLTIIVFSNVAQRLVTRYGVRSVLTTGLTLDAVAMVLFTRLPVDGVYFWDLFPGLIVSGVGMALSFVPMTIAGLTGVRREDAGIASGLINTSRQVGGAIGLAAVTTIVASYTSASTGSGLAAVDGELVNGFQAGFLVLAGMALLGAVLSGALLGQRGTSADVEPLNTDNRRALEEAA